MDTLRNRHGGRQYCDRRTMVCEDCSLTFDMLDANIERDWQEGWSDRPGNWLEYKSCPACRSTNIKQWHPEDNDDQE